MTSFPYDLDRRWAPLLALLRVKSTDGVELDGDTFRATFGRATVRTPIQNIDHTEVTGPHWWFRAVGLRLSLRDDGLTFGTNHHRGLCVVFTDRVPAVAGPRDHSSLWVSVADPEGLAAEIQRRTAG